jgi:uncharacterized protein (TIGR03437 family)
VAPVISSVYYGGSDVFVTKLDPTGKVLFTDIFGGKGIDTGNAIALDPSGNIYVGGATSSSDFPLSKALQNQPCVDNGATGFIIKLTNDGTAILYSTFFGGTQGPSGIAALATDSKGNLYITGSTAAADFPISQGMPAGPVIVRDFNSISGAIIAEISAAGDNIVYSGVISGTSALNDCLDGGSCLLNSLPFTAGVAIALDPTGNVYIGGNTNTINLPVTGNAFSATGAGAFVAKVTAGGLGYLSYIDSGQTQFNTLYAPSTTLYAITVDAAGNLYLAGVTNDSSFPTTSGSLQPTFSNGPNPYDASSIPPDVFLAKLNPSASALVWSTFLGGTGTDEAFSIALDALGNVWATGFTNSTTFPNANGWITGTQFLVEISSVGTELLYSALYPSGTAGQAIAIDALGELHLAGPNGFVSTVNPSAAPSMKIFALQNAFGGSPTARIAASEVISIYGPSIGPATAITAAPVNGFYPTTLGGVTVTIDGYNMPLLYVSASQINAVVPSEVYNGPTYVTSVSVSVMNGTAASPAFPVWIVPSAPQSFPTVLNQDGTVNSYDNPAKFNSIVTFYVTGWQSNFSPLGDGQVATAAQNACFGSCQVTVQTAEFPWTAYVVYGGAAPGIVAGVTQFNVNLGESVGILGSNDYSFVLTGAPTPLTRPIWVAP